MPNHFWIYFLSQEEIIETYRRAGGTRGTFDKDCPNDITNATHALFLYLMPLRIQVWFSTLDEVSGMAFIIGHVNDEFNQMMSRRAAQRCHKVFGCPPDQWTEVDGPEPVVCSLEKEGKTHKLYLWLFRESDVAPRDYLAEKGT